MVRLLQRPAAGRHRPRDAEVGGRLLEAAGSRGGPHAGSELPPFKDFTTSFASMRASCGSADVMPVQPFVLEHRVSGAKVVREGLYVFDPVAFAPPCTRVTLSIHAEKASEKGDTVTIDAAFLRTPRVP